MSVRATPARLPLVVATITAAYLSLFLSYGMELEDEGLLLASALRTLRGEVPHLDFNTGYAPGIFYLNALLLRVFGESAIPLRLALVLVHSATAFLLCAVAQPLAGPALAVAASLGYIALLPVFPGQFASFNVPYPAWWAGLAGLATQAAMDRYLFAGSRRALLIAGICAGIAFSFKQNVGVLAALACGLALAVQGAGRGDPDRRVARVLLVLGLLAALALPVIDLEPAEGLLLMIFGFIVVPLAVLVVGRLLVAHGPVPHAVRVPEAIARVAAGALVPTLPWALWFLVALAPLGFVHEILLIGAGAEHLYGTVLPITTALPGAWALVGALGVALVAVISLPVEREPRLLWPFALALAASAVYVARQFFDLALMPEGVSIALYAQLPVLCFVLITPLSTLYAVRLLLRLRTPVSDPRTSRWIGVVAFAACMFLEIFPRMDEMHLVLALPAPLILAAAAAHRAAEAWARAMRVRRRTVVGAFVGVVAMVAVIVAAPGIRATLAADQVRLGAPRFPVRVEAARAIDLRAFRCVLDYLRPRLGPDDKVFSFPAAVLVNYALGTTGPDRWAYFFPGVPGHGREAELRDLLTTAPPRYVVTLNRRFGYFFESPIYYFLLRAFVRDHYTLVLRSGRYDVLARRAGEAPPAMSPPCDDDDATTGDRSTAIRLLADPDREVRRTAVLSVLALAATDASANGLARIAPSGEAERLMLVRNLGEVGDARGLRFLLNEHVRGKTKRLRAEAAGALMLMYYQDTQRQYLFSDTGGAFDVETWRQLPIEDLLACIDFAASAPHVGIFAAHALAAAQRPEGIPALHALLANRGATSNVFFGTWVQIAAHEALVALGESEHLCDLVALFGNDAHHVQDMMPSGFITAARRDPEVAARCLRRGLSAPEPGARALSAYVAAAVPLTTLRDDLLAARADRDEDVRRAAGWALAHLGS